MLIFGHNNNTIHNWLNIQLFITHITQKNMVKCGKLCCCCYCCYWCWWWHKLLYILMLKHTLHAYQIDKNGYGKLHKTKMLITTNENVVTNACKRKLKTNVVCYDCDMEPLHYTMYNKCECLCVCACVCVWYSMYIIKGYLFEC